MSIEARDIDIINCDREPIHIPGSIQPFGFLIAVSTDWLIARVSENIADFVDRPPRELLGKPLGSLLSKDVEHTLRNLASRLRGADAIERAFALVLMANAPLFDVAIHWSGGYLVIEAEPVSGDTLDAASLVRAMVVRLDQIAPSAAFLREGARQIRALTGFNRVMVYRFDPVGSGEVVAEALDAGLESFLGLNYPASDIPAQARALYLRSEFRVIADVGATAVPITPVLDLNGEPLDQSISVLRAVSPIHLEYLRNMGVGASLSISIIVDGALWGLFACHHYAPRLPGFAQRSAAELFGRMFSMMLESRERQIFRASETRARAVADRLMTAAHDATRLKDAAWLAEVIFAAIPADGVGVSTDGEVVLAGLTPDAVQFGSVIDSLNRISSGKVFTTDRITALIPGGTEFADRAAGMLAIPLSRSPRDYVVLFRAERMRSVRWAGNPAKTIEYSQDGPRLTPRKSFEAWAELVAGAALPFTSAEIHAAETIRVALLEIVLRSSDAAGRDRVQERQELVIAELNHRVRNILSLIRGLISQTRDSSLSADAFVSTLDDRVQAVARAHDQLTAKRWGPASLIDLIVTETYAYLGDKRDRIILDGPNTLIDPAAFTVLALVVHELVTNAAKYGSLSDGGIVSLSWTIDDAGNLHIHWRESGGPPVTAPTRRGFGTTIIERSIPYDLGGSAETFYEIAGFEAKLTIPARFIGKILSEADPADLAPATAAVNGRPLEGCIVLLVEDSLMIALDCEDYLRQLGALDVHTAPSVGRALALIATRDFDFAILDYNLGNESGTTVAHALIARQVSFAFATGYGEILEVENSLKQIGVIRKPYNSATLAAAIIAAGPLARRKFHSN